MGIILKISIALLSSLLLAASPSFATTKQSYFNVKGIKGFKNSYACILKNEGILISISPKRSGTTKIPKKGKVKAIKIAKLVSLLKLKSGLQQQISKQSQSEKSALLSKLKLINEQIKYSQQCMGLMLTLQPPNSTITPTPTSTQTPTVTPTPFIPRPVSDASSVNFTGNSTFSASYYIISKGENRIGEAAKIKIESQDPNKTTLASVRVYDPSENEVFISHFEKLDSSSEFNTYYPNESKKIPESEFALGKNGIYQVRVSGNINVKFKLELPDDVGWGISLQNGSFIPFTGRHDTMYAYIPQHKNRQLRLKLKLANNASILSLVGLTPVIQYNGSGQIDFDYYIEPSDSANGFVVPVILPTASSWSFNATGMPFILTNSEQDAESIGASIRQIKSAPFSGYLVSHKFQEEIAALLPELATHFGEASTLYSSPGTNYPASQSSCKNPSNDDDVLKNIELISNYSGILLGTRWALGTAHSNLNQVTNTQSPWLGTIGASLYGTQICTTNFDCANGSTCISGSCSAQFSQSEDRWDRFQAVTYTEPVSGKSWPLFNGKSPKGQMPYSLVWSAVTAHPCNPYGPNSSNGPITHPELFYRGVAGALSDLLMLAESEQLVGTNGTTDSTYPGFAGFELENLLPVFEIASPYLNSIMNVPSGDSTLGARVYNAWKNALSRMINRHLYDYLVSSENQSSHNLVSFMSFALGVQDPEEQDFYDLAARRFAGRFFDSMRSAGYFQENTGVCSSYSGITNSMIGRYYGLSAKSKYGQDTRAADALEAVYSLFNHTAAPEPSGPIISGFNFNHRIGRGIEDTQYEGAKMLADNIPEVGIWSRNRSNETNSRRSTLLSAASSFDSNIAGLPATTMPWFPSKATFFTHLPEQNYLFPAEETNSFIRKFGDEYIAVKRPGYFTGIFIGKPAASLFYLSHINDYRAPTTDKDLNAAGTVIEDLAPESNKDVSPYNYNPYLGGGLSIFWTPNYGNGIIGTTWSALAQQGLVAWKNDLRYWADYFATNYTLNESSNTLTVTGSIEYQPLNYTRVYHFGDNSLDVTLTVTATQNLSLQKLVDVIPIPTCTRAECGSGSILNRKRYGATLKLNGSPVSGSGASSIVSTASVEDQYGNGMQITLNQPLNVIAAPNGLRINYYGDELQIGRMELALPTSWNAGDTYTISYSLSDKN